MEWTDDELTRLAQEAEKRFERARTEHPDLYGPYAVPYKVMTPESTRGLKRMRLIWLKDNHPDTLDRLMRANVLETHLKNVEARFLEARERIYQELMESRHLLRRSDIMAAHPEITEQDRYYGMRQCEADSQEMAIREVVESF